MSVPLDKQHVIVEAGTSKKNETVPALHPRWIEDVQFVRYQAPPTDLTDRGQYEAWCERLKFIEDDLHWLLQLSHDKFWCQAVFDETLHKLIDSYLRYSPRSYDVIYRLPEESKKKHDAIHRLVFMTCVRMSTYKESKEYHITPSVFGEILYENFIFDIPKVLDLCVLYRHGNGQLLSKMVTNIFTQQPKYNQDLSQTIDTLTQVFDSIQAKCGVLSQPSSPQKIGSPGNKGPHLVSMAIEDFQDIIFYMSDIGLTLTSFLSVYAPACKAFHDSDFLQRLPSFYGAIIPEVFAALKLRQLEPGQKTLLKQKAIQAKKSLLSVFNTVITDCCIQPVLEKSGLAIDYVEDYLQIISSVLSERRFLADYESVYSVECDLDVLLQSSSGVDETRLQYIHEAVNLAFATYGKRKSPKGAMKRGGRRSPDGSPGPMDGGGAMAGGGAMGGAVGRAGHDYQDDTQVRDGACAPRVEGVELDSLVSSVKDLLPDLGEGFIELCLEEFNYEIENVINAVLEDKLPLSLRDIDRLMEREKKEPPPRALVTERKNIFDYDEFDVFHRDDVNRDKVHRGKGNTDQVSLNDQSALKDIKSNISKDYGLVFDVEDGLVFDGFTRDVYDDEYDDTYDTNVVGADDADDADDLTNRRPFTVPRILGGPTRPYKATKAESSESEDSEEERRKRQEFVQDPAKLREQAAERARSQGRGGAVQGRRIHDVKGAAKGQGQSGDVLKNRKWKEQHKGGNRRVMADKKRRV